ncbi:hypothetical protein [Natranaerobius trueperi]|uniref:Uncharacterized protein n=1 Tax=Natranaerobius trueperi TaxID=759412 RepID=A0A226BXN7_9FIRM|nr:hypothetical protein [Natranaerobius trueperi]OWZ82910.1 hypothetical protein CDO51_11555 [Natranaerobius trueperi]
MVWVRSQDKRSLMNVQEFRVEGKRILGIAGYGSISEWVIVLGIYKTPKQSREVLDVIQIKIADKKQKIINMPEYK